MTAARKIDALNAARTIAQELGQNPDAKGTARLAEDLEKPMDDTKRYACDYPPNRPAIEGLYRYRVLTPDYGVLTCSTPADAGRVCAMLNELTEQRDDLLEACKAAEFGANHIDCVRAMQEVLPRIRAAIAKATNGGEA